MVTEWKDHRPPDLIIAIQQLKENNNIVITKPEKGSGVATTDRFEDLHLLFDNFSSEAEAQGKTNRTLTSIFRK